MDKMKCPRCGGHLSRQPVKSRTDGKTEICSACATDEAFELFRDDLTARAHWPITERRWGQL